MKITCLHCEQDLTPRKPDEPVTKLHVGAGEPQFEESVVVGAIARHAPEHPPHAWFEGRDYVVDRNR